MSKSRRIFSMFLDHVIMTIIIIIIGEFIDYIIIDCFKGIKIRIWFAIGLILYTNKDFFGASSFAKRILSFQIVDKKNNSKASVFQCFLRNTLIIIWPIEVIITYFKPCKRFGDIIAGTEVVCCKQNEYNKSISRSKRYIYLITFVLSIIYALFVDLIINVIFPFFLMP